MFTGARTLSGLILPDNDAAASAGCVEYLRCVSVFYVLCFIGSAFVGYFCGAGKPGVPAVCSTMHLTLRVILSVLLTRRMGLAGVGLATGLGWCLAVAYLSYTFFRKENPTAVKKRLLPR